MQAGTARGFMPVEEAREGVDELATLPELLRRTLKLDEQIREIAGELREAAQLEPTPGRGRRRRRQAGDQPVAVAGQQGQVVGDQRRAAVDQAQRQVRLAAARRPAQQHADPIERDASGLDVSPLRCARAHRRAGRATTKRAPHTRRSPSTRFSALTRPPWASAICLEMLRPRPEWVPYFSPAGRSL